MIREFIGYDTKLPVLFNVLPQVRVIHDRDRHPLASTEFSFTRFLAPYFCNYEGWSIFMDNACSCSTTAMLQ